MKRTEPKCGDVWEDKHTGMRIKLGIGFDWKDVYDLDDKYAIDFNNEVVRKQIMEYCVLIERDGELWEDEHDNH